MALRIATFAPSMSPRSQRMYDARLLYHAGAIRIAQGEKAAGEKLVREALKMNPKFDPTGAAEAEKLLAGEKLETGEKREKKAGSGG